MLERLLLENVDFHHIRLAIFVAQCRLQFRTNELQRPSELFSFLAEAGRQRLLRWRINSDQNNIALASDYIEAMKVVVEVLDMNDKRPSELNPTRVVETPPDMMLSEDAIAIQTRGLVV